MDRSEDPFYLLAESSPDAIFVGTHGRFAYANPVALKLFGAATAEQLLGQPVIERVHPDERAVVAARIKRLIENGEKAPLLEETYLRLDGTPVDVEVSAVPFRYQGEDGGLVFVRDITQRKRAEAELRQNQQLLRSIIDNSTAVIFVKDPEGRYLLINRRYAELFHVSNEAMRGRTDHDLFPPAIADAVRYADAQVLATGMAQEFEEQVPHDEELRTYLALKFPLYDSAGQPYAVCGIATDITERKRSEDAVRRSEAQLREAQRIARLGSWELDLDRNQLRWSDEVYRLFEIDPQRFGASYEAFLDAIHPDDREFVNHAYTASVAERTPYDIVHRLLMKDGRVKYVNERGRTYYDADGRPLRSVGTVQDITERKLAQESVLQLNAELERRVAERTLALAESEARFRAFMAHSPAATWIVDGSGRFHYVNPVYCRMFGVGEVDPFGAGAIDLTGKLIGEIYPEPLAQQHLRDHADVIEQGRVVEAVRSGLRADGEPGEFLVVKFPIRGADDVPLVCGIALDVTEQRRTLANLRAANQQLAGLAAERAAHLRELAGELIRAEQRERDSLYELLHDHVQPLLVAARLRLAGFDPRKPPESWQRIAQETSSHITAAIDTARSLSVELNPPLVRDRGLGEALDWLRRWVRSNHGLAMQLSCDLDAEPADAAVRLLCFKAVRELLMNVAKHAGTSRVEVRLAPHGRDMLSIVVEDCGKGFDPRAALAAAGGSGLANIERRLGMIGGRLEIDSAVGAPTTVTLLAPRLAASGSTTRAGADTPARTRENAAP